MVLVFDGSGSVQSSNFEILKKHTLINNYQMQYFGENAIRMGVLQFGNGIIMPDGKTVSPAINAQKLASNKDDVQAAIEGLQFGGGFANMAQASPMAEDMFTKGSLRPSQPARLYVLPMKKFKEMVN